MITDQIGLHSVLLPLSIEQSINQSNPADWARLRYRRNVISLLIDMSADCRTTTLGRHIGRHIGPVLVEISVVMSVEMSTDTSRSIYRPIVGRHVDRHICRASVWYGMVRYTLFKSKKHASPNDTQLVSMEGVFVQT